MLHAHVWWSLIYVFMLLVTGARALPHITHLTAKPSRMIGVQVGVWCLSARATPTHRQAPESLFTDVGQ